ncbi:MAG TPA: PEP-CTERM sorting domain-containing protein [Phycisphaerae bacterium]|nr:PEP-CTERM sorting domain-containing protein [Phycisphaerae bacterium]
MRYIGLLAGIGLILAVTGTAGALTSTWDVATVHGVREFTIGSGDSSLLYNQQGWTDYVWYENNGSTPGTIATTTAGPNKPEVDYRSGMRTFATTDVAVGQKLSDIKLEFEYNNTLGGYTTINFFVTDGTHLGIFAPTSSGIGEVGVIDPINGWNKMTIDLTRGDIPSDAKMAIYEHDGLSSDYTYPYTTFQWDEIKNLTIAGWYDYQRSPTGGWDAWGTSFDANHGLALIWGDTANSNNIYGSQTREIRNVVVTFGGDDYIGTFNDATVPEPVTMAGLVLGVGCLARYVRRRRK